MNKIFKVIWNHAAQRFDVVSELTKSNGKSSSTTDNRIEPSKALLAIGVAGVALLGSTNVMAVTASTPAVAGSTQITAGSGNDPVYIATDTSNVAIGKDASAQTPIIDGTQEGGGTVAIGEVAKASRYKAVAIGSGATAAGQFDTAIGAGASASGTNSVAIGQGSNAAKQYAISIGSSTKASDLESISIGYKNNSTSRYTIAIGGNVDATAESAVAIGKQSKSTATRGTAIGMLSGVAATDGVAVGSQASVNANGDSGIAIGRRSAANNVRSISIGRNAITNGTYAVAVGTESAVNGDRSNVVGDSNLIGSTSSNVSALGTKNRIGATATYNSTTDLLNQSTIVNTDAVTNSKVVGNNNYINSSNTYVLGSGVGVKDDGSVMDTVANSVYLGNDSTITSSTATITAANAGSVKNLDKDGDAGATSTAGSKGTVTEAVVSTLTYGGFAGATSVGAVSVGAAGSERRIVNMAAGEVSKTSTDAINGSQLYAVTEVIGKGINIQNNAGTNVSNILPGEAIAFKNGNLTTANVSAVDGNVAVSFDVDQGTFNATQTGALIANTSDTGVATVADVANAVNSGYWNIGNGAGNVDKVSFGDEVRFLNGTNTTVTVAKNGNSRTDVTYDTDFSKLPVANTDTTTITNDGGTIKVDVNTGNGSVGTDGTPNANNNASKVANISSVVDLVANVGWNVYQESVSEATKKDLVKAGDNVVFAKGANTTVSVETLDGGKTTIVKYDVDLANVNTAVKTGTVSSDETTGVASSDNTNGNIATVGDVANAINKSGWQTTLSDGTVETINPGEKVNYLNGTTSIANVTKDAAGNVNVSFEVNRTALTQDIAAGNDGKAVLEGTTTNGDNFVTAGDVMNTINNVYWVATSGTDGGAYATSGHTKSDEQVKAGNTVTFKAGNGLTIKQEGMNFTYAVATGGLSSDTNKDNVTTTLGQAVPSTGSGNIATVGDVANAINNAGWVTKTTGGDVVVINPGDSVNYVDGKGTKANITANADGGVNVTFDVDLPVTKVNGDTVSGDINFVNGNTTTVTNTDGKIKVEVNTGDSMVEDGKAKSTTDADAAKVATVGDIVDTINKVYHSVNSTTVANTNGESAYTKNDASQINAGDTVNYNAGKNIKISGSGNTFEFATTDNVTFTNANVTSNLTVDGNTTVNNFTVKPGANIDMGGNIIHNVSSGVADTDGVNVKQLKDAIGNATTSFVWKITGNNDATKATDVGNQTTVSFNNGEGTVAVVDGTKVAYNVNVDGTSTQITYVDDAGNTLVKNADGSYTNIKDGSTVTSPTIKNSQVSVAFGDVSANTTTGVVATPDTATKAASTQDVANAINGSGFTLTTSNSSTGVVSGTTSELINPGETITIDAGNNINITQSGNKVSVATSMTPTFTTVQVGGNSGPVMSGDANGDVKVAKADGSAAKITNVAPGDVSSTSTDAVNGSQLYAVANGINNKFGDIHNKIDRNNKDLRAGVAGSNAAAALPQVFKSGRSMVAASAGTFKGQSALAVGYSRASDNGKLILKLQGNANSRGDVGGGVGVGYQW